MCILSREGCPLAPFLPAFLTRETSSRIGPALIRRRTFSSPGGNRLCEEEPDASNRAAVGGGPVRRVTSAGGGICTGRYYRGGPGCVRWGTARRDGRGRQPVPD